RCEVAEPRQHGTGLNERREEANLQGVFVRELPEVPVIGFHREAAAEDGRGIILDGAAAVAGTGRQIPDAPRLGTTGSPTARRPRSASATEPSPDRRSRRGDSTRLC